MLIHPAFGRAVWAGDSFPAKLRVPFGIFCSNRPVVGTRHGVFDYPALVDRARLIVDTRNALKGFRSEKIVRL